MRDSDDNPKPQGGAAGLVDAMLQLERLGLNVGAAGNVSERDGDGYLITASGVPPAAMTSQSIVRMSTTAEATDTRPRPSSEWRFHRDIYCTREDVGAIVHVHSAYATALACQHRGIPAFHYMVAVAGGRDIRCAPYARFGTQALSEHALDALENRNACLLANHGMISVGSTVTGAVALACEVERLAEQYLLSLSAGEPVLLSEAEMDEVLEAFENYGNRNG